MWHENGQVELIMTFKNKELIKKETWFSDGDIEKIIIYRDCKSFGIPL